MSSNHTWVSDQEWAEMQRRVQNADAYVINREAEARRLQEEARQRRREIEQMQSINRQAVDATIADYSHAYQQTLQAAGSQFRARLTAEEGSFQHQIQSLVDRVRTVSGQLDLADAQVEYLARTYNDAFLALAAQRTQGRERAESVRQELDRLMERIRALNPERFLPEQFTTLESMRAALSANMRTGDYQAAMAVSQNAILSASRLLTRLLLLNEEYNQQLYRTQSAAASLEERIAALDTRDGVLAVDLRGQRQEMDYDIDYWSSGEFGEIRQQLTRIQADITGGRMDTGELRRAQRIIDQMGQQLEQCDRQARNRLAGSVFVEDTAAILYNSLTQSGWSLQESGFHHDDGRQPYTMQYDDGHGSNVSIVVSQGHDVTAPVYSMEVFGTDEYRATAIKEGVHATVRQSGLSVQGIERRNDCHLNPTPQAFIDNMINQSASQRTAGAQHHR